MSAPVEYGTAVADVAAREFRQWRAGDEEALTRLVRRLTPLLWHLARAYRIDGAAAEDAVQSTWTALVRAADSVQDPQAVLRWLTVTVQREAARTVRRAGRVDPTDPTGTDGPSLLERADQPQPGADEVVLGEQRTATLWRHVASLSDRCQRLLRVIAFSDRPDYARLSADLGMPVGSIGPTRGRCLAKLRESLVADPDWVTA